MPSCFLCKFVVLIAFSIKFVSCYFFVPGFYLGGFYPSAGFLRDNYVFRGLQDAPRVYLMCKSLSAPNLANWTADDPTGLTSDDPADQPSSQSFGESIDLQTDQPINFQTDQQADQAVGKQEDQTSQQQSNQQEDQTSQQQDGQTDQQADQTVGQQAGQQATNKPARPALTNLILSVSYDGSSYLGFVGPTLQSSSLGTSVANELLKAIALIHGYVDKSGRARESELDGLTGCENGLERFSMGFAPGEKPFCLITASRTDRGVHASGGVCQYQSFDRAEPCGGDLAEFHEKLNRHLPQDIKVLAVVRAPSQQFNVRFDNLGKWYAYRVDLSPTPSLFDRLYSWQIAADRNFRNTLFNKYGHLRRSFSLDLLRAAASAFVGRHNFQGFSRKGRRDEAKGPVDPFCTIHSIEVERVAGIGEHDELPSEKFTINVRGDRFLYQMVRCIVCHLVLSGFGIISPEEIAKALETGAEIPHIPSAPSSGLTLRKVYFEESVDQAIAKSKQAFFDRHNVLLK